MSKAGITKDPAPLKSCNAPEYEMADHNNYPHLKIAPSSDCISLIRDLMKETTPPYWILYYLKESRRAYTPGRYLIPQPITQEELFSFMDKFSEFLEEDSRHEIWFGSVGDDSRIVFNQYKHLNASGTLESFKEILKKRAFEKKKKLSSADTPSITVRGDLDYQEEAVMKEYSWIFLERI